MRKFPIALLLLGASSVPSLAIAQEPAQNSTQSHQWQGRQKREATTVRREAPATAEHRVLVNPNAAPPAAAVQGESVRHVPPAGGERRVVPVTPTTPINAQGAHPEYRQRVHVESVEQHRPGVTPQVERRSVNPQVTQNPRVERGRPPVISHVPRIGTEPPARIERNRPNWNRNWRNDQRYDWNNWRRIHRPYYHLRPYRDPYGWAYQLFGIGWRLWPQYYVSGYWIDDPAMYRLPPAPPGTRWIRYYNDALLVDIYTGEVLDVIHDFFW